MEGERTASEAGNDFARAFDAALRDRPEAPFLWVVPGEPTLVSAQPADRGAADMPADPGVSCEPGASDTAPFAPGSEPNAPCAALSYAALDAMARRLEATLAERGVGPGDFVPVDLANSPELVALVLAAARVGFALVTLNARLSAAEKRLRLGGLEAALGHTLPEPLTQARVEALATGEPVGDAASLDARGAEGVGSHAPNSAAALTPAIPTPSSVSSVPGAATAVVMFTSGTTGSPKAVPLSWDNLCGSARASNACLGGAGKADLWQATLPMYHVGGLQVLVRSVLAGRPLVLYRHFDASRVLADATALGATHISVVDASLQDLLDADEARARRGLTRVLPQYACLLLGGSAPNPATLARAVAAGARVWASFGMTETASQIANAPVTKDFDGWLDLMDGYEARVVQGQLAVAGPGVTGGYLNASTPRTADGLLLTGDVGEVRGRRLHVGERTGDMFVSGGENVYPTEVENALRLLDGVRDAYVFGAPDPRWGRRPVAFVEAPASEGQAAGAEEPAALRAERLRAQAGRALSKVNRPERLYVLDRLPRTGIGKVDRSALRARDEARLEVVRAELWLIEQPLVRPFVTAATTMHTRTSALLRVEDRRGHVGLGECVAFPTAWYLPETLGQDVAALEDRLIPLVLGRPLLDPWQAGELLERGAGSEAAALPMARATLESALWDLWARVRGVALWRLLREEACGFDDAEAAGCGLAEPARVAAGIVVGIADVDRTRAAVDRAVAAGYRRVKLKVRPGDDVDRVRAVRADHPDLMITLDANQSYVEDDLPALRALDELDIRCIEEPLDPRRLPQAGPRGLFGRLERLQGQLRMAVCLDESLTCLDDTLRVLDEHPGLRCLALKIGKLGGVGPALRLYREAQARGVEIWLGGMYETSVSKRLHAAFETLPGIEIPGDISATARYFARDVATPELSVEAGEIALNGEGHPSGLGCDLDEEALAACCVEHRVFEA